MQQQDFWWNLDSGWYVTCVLFTNMAKLTMQRSHIRDVRPMLDVSANQPTLNIKYGISQLKTKQVNQIRWMVPVKWRWHGAGTLGGQLVWHKNVPGWLVCNADWTDQQKFQPSLEKGKQVIMLQLKIHFQILLTQTKDINRISTGCYGLICLW